MGFGVFVDSTARLLSAAAKNTQWTCTATTQARAELTQVQQRRTTGWYLSLALSSARLDTRCAPSTESRQAQDNGAATWRSATIYETKLAAGAWSSTSASPINVTGVAATPCNGHLTRRTSTHLCILQLSAK
jgi:hypothetical protein